MLKDLFSYQNYRHFIKDYLEFHDLTYRDFCSKYSKGGKEFKPMTLSKVLSQNKKGEYTYTIINSEWSRILSCLKLKKSEVEYLTLLKFYNDNCVKHHANDPLIRALKGSLNKLKTVDRNLSRFSAKSLLIAEAYDSLPQVLSKHILNETYKQVEYCMQGMKEYSVEQSLHKIHNKINKII